MTLQATTIDTEKLQEILRPIRELSAVWDVPLSEYLDSYLENITNIEFGDEYDPNTLNFSQAGLFIQGSTNIFAKKVKHLYNLAVLKASSSDENDKDQKKRKRKVVEWVVDDKLAPIDDPDACENIQLTEDNPRIEITTMPKIPFCLLTSLDSQSTNDSSYRVNSVPDEKYSVILLDPSINLDNEKIDVFDDDDDDTMPFPLGNKEEEEMGDIVKNANLSTEEEEDRNDDEAESLLPPPKQDSDSDENENEVIETKEMKKLDPDSLGLSSLLKPFKMMQNPKIPTSFMNKEISQKKHSMKPFHLDLFEEMFHELKEVRANMKKEKQIENISSITEEDGREQVLNDLDTYVEEDIPLPLAEEYDDDSNNISSQTFISLPGGNSSYLELCVNSIHQMIQMGREQVMKNPVSTALDSWERKISPVLENEQKMKPFNMDETLEWIEEMLKLHEGEMTFKQLTSELELHEVSRVFFSLLILANQRKLKIETINQKSNDDDYKIILLEK